MSQKDTEAKRIRPAKLQKALTGLTAISQLNNYDPKRTEFGRGQLQQMMKQRQEDADAELAAANAFNQARDKATASEWALYNFYLEAADQVMGQYGSNSDEYASIGYKKKSEYRKTAPGKAKKKDGGGIVG